MYIFTGAYFYELGMPLHFILLFYGLEFGLRGALCPFGLSFFQKVGVIKAFFTASFFLILFFVGISFSEDSLIIGFSSLILAAISGAIYYPILDVLEAIYITDDKNRTKQISMGIIAGSFGRVIGAAVAGFLLTHSGFDSVVVLVSLALILSTLPFFILPEPTTNMRSVERSLDVYKFLLDDNFKKLHVPFFGLQLTIIVRAVMIPLFIFTIVEQMDHLGYLIALTLIIEKIFTLFAGHYTDKFGTQKTTHISLWTYTSAMGAYIFLAKSPLSIFFIESYYKIVNNIYDSAVRSGFHSYARKHYKNDVLLFGAGWQMSLCFGELFVLPLYGLLAYFIGLNIFYVAFALGIIGVWIVNRYFKNP